MLDLKVNQQYFGFLLENIEEISDIHSMGYLFTHIKSAAKLFYVQNDDDNKVFSITFKTPPEDDCGTAHILEHSVLCGSKKYHVKDPFNELAKGSLHTYLNALTYGDKTMYPVASRNEKDLMNMMDVYLDAVLYPRIDELKEIFLQEGWHYEWDENHDLTISGVVYNEMKGALSDTEALLQDCIAKSLFKTSIYGLESGGDPRAIPKLSYEKFLAFHKKYYHPSNSFLYLYGDMDVLKQLEYIDKAYLSDFDKANISAEITLEAPMDNTVTVFDTYPIEGNKTEKQGLLSYNVKIGSCDDPERILALQILGEILMETNASPLKKALIESCLVVDGEGWLDSASLEMVYSIVGKKADVNDLRRFQCVIDTALKEIVANGFDKKLIDSCIQKYEFYFREEDYGQRPKGLTYGMRLMKSWLHGGNPNEALRHWRHFENIKKDCHEGYFENLIQLLFIDNTQKSFVAIAAETGKQTTMDNAFKKEMADKKNALSNAQIKEIDDDLVKLAAFQTKEETVEELAEIPMLAISDISKEAEIIPMEKSTVADCDFLFSPLSTNGIVYVQLLFDISRLPARLLPYAGLLANILGKLDTENYTYDSLPTEIGLSTGGIYCSNDIYSNDNLHCKSFFAVNGKALIEKQEQLINLFEEILLGTDFTKTENMKKIIGATKIAKESQLLNSSHTAAIQKSASAISLGSARKDGMGGISFCHFLEKLMENMDAHMVGMIFGLQETLHYLISQKHLTVAISCEKEAVSSFIMGIEKLILKLPKASPDYDPQVFTPTALRQGFTGASKVQYNALCQNFIAKGFVYSGHMRLLKTILDLEFLWNRVRVQGGAYGCGCNFLRNGNYFFYSYRDPNIENTFAAYQNAGDFLENFCNEENSLDKFILGAINALDQPKSNAEKFDLALSRHFGEITSAQLQMERDEILNSNKATLRQFIPLLKDSSLDNICTIGNYNAIQKAESYYNNIEPLIP